MLVPVRLAPWADESLAGYGRRLAEANDVSPSLLLTRAHLGKDSHPPPFFGLVASMEVIAKARSAWGLSKAQTLAMTLES